MAPRRVSIAEANSGGRNKKNLIAAVVSSASDVARHPVGIVGLAVASIALLLMLFRRGLDVTMMISPCPGVLLLRSCPGTARAGVERATKATAIRSLFMMLDTPIVIGDRGDALTPPCQAQMERALRLGFGRIAAVGSHLRRIDIRNTRSYRGWTPWVSKSPDADEAPGLLRGKREDTSSPRASLVRIDSPRASSVTYATPTEADGPILLTDV